MNTILLKTDDEDLKKAAGIIQEGGLVAFPTETVYGLGVNALLTDGAPKVYAAKGRPSDNPLIIHLANPEDAEKYCYTTPTYYRIAKLFMPGPVTYILKKKPCIPACVTGELDTVAVRIPRDPTAHRLIELAGVPIAAPSANLSGRPSTTTADHCIEDLFGKIEAIIDGPDAEIGLESTILAETGTPGEIKMLRPGGVTVEMLESAGFSVSLDKAITEKLADNERPLAPGMKYRHYAPNAQVCLLDGSFADTAAYMLAHANDDGTDIICFEEDSDLSGLPNVHVLGSFSDKETQAHKLFALLRSFDDMPNVKKVYARLPDKSGIGLAIFNRLLKASGYTVLKV